MDKCLDLALFACVVCFATSPIVRSAEPPVTLEQRLLDEPPAELLAEIHQHGDARRGAILFHQPSLGCFKCHVTVATDPEQQTSLGPDLARLKGQPQTDDAHLLASILQPSAAIRAGYETLGVVLNDGRTLTGLNVPSETGVSLRDPSTQRVLAFTADEVDEVIPLANQSIMPAGVVNALQSRAQFLDLMRYVFDIRDGGPERAKELRPPPELVGLQLPAYEAHIDHAGLLRALDKKSYERGRQIYGRVCQNCHGTRTAPGSLPTAPQFNKGTIRNGHDPFALYQTVTHGFGLMVPQTWMVPRQKYDVIHYIREEFFKRDNPTQYVPLTDNYLASLPAGNTLGPEPVELAPWSDMNYGPWMFNTIEVSRDGSNIAYKGLAVRVDGGPGGVSRGNQWLLFDHDTMRVAAGWRHSDQAPSRFIDWEGIHFDGRHQAHPHVVGQIEFANPTGPGWANPETGLFDDDQRVVGRDGKRYGPLPRSWARYLGMYHAGQDAIVSYRVGDMNVLEHFSSLRVPTLRDRQPQPPSLLPVFLRTIELQPSAKRQSLLIATGSWGDMTLPAGMKRVVVRENGPADSARSLMTGLAGDTNGCELRLDGKRLCADLSPSKVIRTLLVWMVRPPDGLASASAEPFERLYEAMDARLEELLREPTLSERIKAAARPLWPELLTTTVKAGDFNASGFAEDELTAPEPNPWLARLRFSGLDFYDDGDRMVVCSWDGDVFVVSGLSQLDAGEAPAQLTWRRIASGLFQPLGVKLVDGEIYLTCRDQLVILRDPNRDGAVDFFECFNNDHQVTEHFHEFAMGLQRDDQGNFYYAKSARHALPALVPHHGTLLRVSPDGSRTSILAVGFRAANGVCLNPDGTFIVTDQEGHWNPKNRINWVRPGGFYGNMYGYHDVTDSSDEAMAQPLCWITNEFDRSPAELLWAPEDRWGNLGGTLLNLSYGYGKVFTVPHEHLDSAGRVQGGVCALPIDRFPTGIMRGRFHPRDGQLYVCGLFAWASSQQAKEGGLYRIRYRGRGATVPVKVVARQGELQVTFSDALDLQSVAELDAFAYEQWGLKRTRSYGSPHVDERKLRITAATLSSDRRTLSLMIPELSPTWCFELACELRTLAGERIERVIHGTIHTLERSDGEQAGR